MKQFVTREHELEPVPGLPGTLPDGEQMLWQGRPSARLVARHVLKNRWIAGYFLFAAALVFFAVEQACKRLPRLPKVDVERA